MSTRKYTGKNARHIYLRKWLEKELQPADPAASRNIRSML
jgi:hypothetical protein